MVQLGRKGLIDDGSSSLTVEGGISVGTDLVVAGQSVGQSAYHTQTTWYIDAINGNDSNPGNTALASLKTFAELSKRWGSGNTLRPSSGRNVTVHLMSDLPSTDPMTFSVSLGPSVSILIKGMNTTIQKTGTFTNVVDKNRGSNQFLTISDSALTGSSPLAAYTPTAAAAGRIYDTTNQSYFWILRETSSGTAVVSEPITAINVTGTNFPTIGPSHRPAQPVATGHSYVIQRLTRAFPGSMGIVTADNTGATNASHANQVVFEDLYLDRVTSQHVLTFLGSGMVAVRFYGCIVVPAPQIQPVTGDHIYLYSYLRTGFGGSGGFTHIRASVINAGWQNANLGATLDLDTIIMGGGMGVTSGHFKLGTVGFFECSSSLGGVNNKQGDGLHLGPGTHVWNMTFSDTTHLLYGSGSQGAGIRCEAGATLAYQTNPPTVVGSSPGVNDFILAGATGSRAWIENNGDWSTPKTNSWTNFNLSTGSNGLGGNATNVENGAKIVRSPGL